MPRNHAPERHRKILDLLARQPEVGVHELTERLGVSSMTVRRDLDALESQGQVKRTHGGAILAAASIVVFEFQERRQVRLAEKCAIARRAVERIAPGSTLILDTGTTTLEVARHLGGIPDLKVLTTSLAIASCLFAYETVELVLLGGTVNRRSPDICGSLTIDNLRLFRADLAIIGADAVDPKGLYTREQEIARVAQAMIESAEKTILVADSSKCSETSFYRFAPWEAVDALVVDDGLPAAGRRWLKRCVKEIDIVTP